MNTNITTTKTMPRKRSPKNCLTQLICLRLTADELANVEHYAVKESRSRASFLRILILMGLEDFKRHHKHCPSLPNTDELQLIQDKQLMVHPQSNFFAED